MSGGKRLPKRSILGTRISAPGEDGKFYPGIIQAMKTSGGGPGAAVAASSAATAATATAATGGEEQLGESKYSVRFEDTRKVKEFRESEIIGPGFQNVTSSKLRAGQIVYVTHCNREMQGSVIHHRPNIDQVIIQLLHGGPEVKKRLDEVRLLESRKSARLISHGATDFSKLADFNIVHERKRLNSETNSDISATSGRKRRGSETLSDSSGAEEEYFHLWHGPATEQPATASRPAGRAANGASNSEQTPIMSECTAAMVLMNLSFGAAGAAGAAAGRPRANGEDSLLRTPRQNASEGLPLNMSSSSSSPSPPAAASSPIAVAANVMIDGSVSPSTSSGVSSLGSSWQQPPGQAAAAATAAHGAVQHVAGARAAGQQVQGREEAEALLQLSNQESDEGIVSDQSSSAGEQADGHGVMLNNNHISPKGAANSHMQKNPTSYNTGKKRIKTDHFRIVYQCTWPRCSTRLDSCVEIERHVRRCHLNRADPVSEEDNDHEEEFYYTEIEVPLGPTSPAIATVAVAPASTPIPVGVHSSTAVSLQNGYRSNNGIRPLIASLSSSSSSPTHSKPVSSTSYAAPASLPTVVPQSNSSMSSSRPRVTSVAPISASLSKIPVLTDHMDMARPPHENPEYYVAVSSQHASSGNGAVPTPLRAAGITVTSGAVPITIPMTSISFGTGASGLQQQQQQRQGVVPATPTTNGGASKYIRLSPKPVSGGAASAGATGGAGSSTPKSPVRRPRGDAKKCRKVYGMDHRDLWCTQCKWKKACSRFGEASGAST